MRLVFYMYTNKMVMLNNWTVSCLKRCSQCNLKHAYQIPSGNLQLQLQLMYTIAHLLGISDGKHLRRSSWVINLKHCTFMSLAVEPMCFFPVKFMLTNLHYILNWWYSLDIRTMVITLCTIHKKILFFTSHMPSLIRNCFLNALILIWKSTNCIISYWTK